MKPKFSIITICLNEQAFIRRTCDSVVAQSYDHYEWIIIDGASTDATLAILEKYRSRVTTLISEPDQGIYDAMNKGIAKSTGNYLVFLNGGDEFASDKILEQVANAPKKDLICGNIYINEIGGDIVVSPESLNTRYFLTHMAHHQASFFNRCLFEQFGNYDTSFQIRGDFDFYARLLKTGRVSYFHLDQPLSVFHRDGISSDSSCRKIRDEEDHRIRMKYFPRYRWSFKTWRKQIRNLFAGPNKT